MENLFKASGCEEEAQNPLMSALSNMMFTDPALHAHGLPMHAEAFEDAWENAEAEMHGPVPHFMVPEPAPVEPEEIWDEAALDAEFDPIWGGPAADLPLDGEMDAGYHAALDNWLQQWNSSKTEYVFDPDNKYSQSEDCFALALEKERIGQTDEAILLLEVEVGRHPENSEAWGMLGRLHASNDEDRKAIAAMLRGLAVDPYNLDLLMSLGISCTNEFDEDQALMYLKTWLQHHPIYAEIPVDQSSNLKDDILEAFKVASSINSQDPDVFQAIGVLSFLESRFAEAEDGFRAALMMRQEDPALWNRLGAALAKQQKTEEAFACYHKALEMKPDFVRTWGNLGLAYSNLKDYENCARFYLCALTLNPRAEHIYSYLTTAFIMMNRFDLVEKLQRRDPSVFRSEFQVITRESLPRSSRWAEEFNLE
jgi:tetratricopeptide (TPR) repeat protein